MKIGLIDVDGHHQMVRGPCGYRVLSHDESMEIEFRHLREMAERYGALIERDRRERDVPV